MATGGVDVGWMWGGGVSTVTCYPRKPPRNAKRLAPSRLFCELAPWGGVRSGFRRRDRPAPLTHYQSITRPLYCCDHSNRLLWHLNACQSGSKTKKQRSHVCSPLPPPPEKHREARGTGAHLLFILIQPGSVSLCERGDSSPLTLTQRDPPAHSSLAWEAKRTQIRK